MSVDTRDMEIVHRAFRRESRLLVELVAAVAPGDTARARVVAGHFRDYRRGLQNHHEGEDELLWPPLLSRADPGADVVPRMEAQHERVGATLARLDVAVPAWEAGAGADERDTVVAALADHRAVLLDHLDDEETTLLPLAAEHLTEAEWASLGAHLVASTPVLTLLTLFGLVLEDADAAERATLLHALPAPVRGVWHVVGRPRYARHIRRVRAARPHPFSAQETPVSLKTVTTALTAAIVLFVLSFGTTYLLAPETIAPGFGLPTWPAGDGGGFLVLKGVRDVVGGLVPAVLLLTGQRRALGWVLLVEALIPLGDMTTVLAHGGSVGVALGVHGLTAVLLAVTGLLVLRETRAPAPAPAVRRAR